jgi:hypothetical protein
MVSVVVNLLNSWYINGINLINNLVKKNSTSTTRKRKSSINSINSIDDENNEVIHKKQRFN